jgi:PIN domain nuclease of toxin-antitoxin system
MNLPLLVDTCALIWIAGMTGNQHLGAVEGALDQARADGKPVYVSPMTAWELGMLAAKGRLPLPLPVKAWIDRVMLAGEMRWAALSVEVLLASNTLPGNVQGDPADRIIIATAREYGFRVVTRDRKILDYAEMGHVMALEC